MYMFRSRKSSLAKRLWKARIKKEHETGSEAKIEKPNSENILRTNVLRRLKENQLEMLVTAVESGGSELSTCVLLPKDVVEDPHVRCCQTWRWPEIRQPCELKQLPMCETTKDPVYICCNPYHWSRLCKPESPPPPYCRFARDRLKPEDRAPSESSCFGVNHQLELRGSLTTNGEGESCSREWCKLAYWELSNRVGRQYGVETSSVNVFWDIPHGDGLCLATLATHSFSPPEAVERARKKIGRGLTLSLEEDGVWAYNRSDSPMFVNSPALDDPDSRSLLVYRVPSGHCLKVFIPGAPTRHWDPHPPTGPIDPNSVRISFAKGWGPKYSRQEVTACPTWLEVLLAPCR
uniref:Mothers against decapentaplegic homolog n=1 Tax=Clastoptera arizonana TaxID=38151 RepID=A0A1B6D1W7_9HEMI